MNPRAGRGQVLLTVDAEEWFHAPETRLGRDESAWEGLPQTLPDTLPRTVDLLAALGVKGTFFVLGWAAARHPRLVRRVAEAGHEVACHGWGHRPVDGLSPEAFRRDLLDGKASVEDAASSPALGFRAPRWSMPDQRWPYEIMAEAGFLYSSSRLPVPGLRRRRPAQTVAGVFEVPALRFPWPALPLPAGGTLALRILPRALLRAARDGALASGRPAVYWFHPWELMPEAPRLEGTAFFRWVRYSRLEALPSRIAGLVEPGDRRVLPFVQSWRADSSVRSAPPRSEARLDGGAPEGP